MAKDGHAILPQNYPRSSDATSRNNNGTQKRKRSKCFVFMLAFLVLMSIALLGFSSVVLRIKSPRMKIDAVEIRKLGYGRTADNFVWLNMTMVITGITIKNTNYGGRFKFQDSKLSVLYGNTEIGSTKIGGGSVHAREKRRMNNVTVQVTAKMVGDQEENGNLISSEIGLEIVKLSSHARLSGEILVLKKIKRYRTAVMNCTMSLKLSNQEVQDLRCM